MIFCQQLSQFLHLRPLTLFLFQVELSLILETAEFDQVFDVFPCVFFNSDFCNFKNCCHGLFTRPLPGLPAGDLPWPDVAFFLQLRLRQSGSQSEPLDQLGRGIEDTVEETGFLG